MDIQLAARQSKSTLQMNAFDSERLEAAQVYGRKRHLVLEERAPDMLVLLVDERPVAVFDCSAIAADVWRQLTMDGANG